MLPKTRRIQRSLFPLLKASKDFFGNKVFAIKLVPYSGKESRFSVSISKKIEKKAVMRNRLRRLGYKLLEKYAKDISRPILLQLSWKTSKEKEEEVESALQALLSKIKNK